MSVYLSMWIMVYSRSTTVILGSRSGVTSAVGELAFVGWVGDHSGGDLANPKTANGPQ